MKMTINTPKTFLAVLAFSSLAQAMDRPSSQSEEITEGRYASFCPSPTSQTASAVALSHIEIPPFIIKSPTDILNELGRFKIEESLKTCPKKLEKLIIRYKANTEPNQENPVLDARLSKVFLNGPSGSGKTTLAQSIAYFYNAPSIFIKPAELSNSFKDSGPAIINALFNPHLKRRTRLIFIVDELSALLEKYNNPNSGNASMVQHFWQQLDECLKNPYLQVIASNNDPIKITQLEGRFGAKFDIPFPTTGAKEHIMIHNLQSNNFNFDPTIIRAIAKKSYGFSLREVENFLGIIRDTAGKNVQLSSEDMEKAFQSEYRSYLKRIETKKTEERSKLIKEFALVGAGVAAIGIVAGLSLTYLCHVQNQKLAIQFHDQGVEIGKKQHADAVGVQKSQFDDELARKAKEHADALASQDKHYLEEVDRRKKEYKDSLETNERHHQETLKNNTRNNREAIIGHGLVEVGKVAVQSPFVQDKAKEGFEKLFKYLSQNGSGSCSIQ